MDVGYDGDLDYEAAKHSPSLLVEIECLQDRMPPPTEFARRTPTRFYPLSNRCLHQ